MVGPQVNEVRTFLNGTIYADFVRWLNEARWNKHDVDRGAYPRGCVCAGGDVVWVVPDGRLSRDELKSAVAEWLEKGGWMKSLDGMNASRPELSSPPREASGPRSMQSPRIAMQCVLLCPAVLCSQRDWCPSQDILGPLSSMPAPQLPPELDVSGAVSPERLREHIAGLTAYNLHLVSMVDALDLKEGGESQEEERLLALLEQTVQQMGQCLDRWLYPVYSNVLCMHRRCGVLIMR